MAVETGIGKLLPLHDLKNVNTVLGMLYDANGVYRAGFDPDVFYNTILLDSLKYGEENYVHLKYSETISIRKGQTTARFRRWAGLTPTLQPLREGIPPAPDKHAYETIEVGNVFSFGRWSEYTDKVDLSIINEVIAERSVQYGEVANQTKELYARKTWLSAPNEFFANFKSGFADLAFGDEITLDDLRFLVARMKRMMVKPISGKFNYICSTEFINGLIDDPRVKQYMEIEQTTGKLWGSGDAFDMFELSFVPTMLDEFAYPDTEFPGVYELATGKEVIRLYAVMPTTYNSSTFKWETTIYYLDVHEEFIVKAATSTPAKDNLGQQYLKDGSVVEQLYKWEIPTDSDVSLGAGNTQLTGDPTNAVCTLRKATKTIDRTAIDTPVISYSGFTAVTDYAPVNALIAAGGFMQLPVHRGILFGDEAMVKLAIEGLSDSPKIIVKALGSSGVSDPIDQRQSIGFKVDGFGLAIKRPESVMITYSIPKFAELAALTSKVVFGDYITMDDRVQDGSGDNDINTLGEQVLRVDGVNVPSDVHGRDIVASPMIAGFNDYPKFSTLVAYAIGDVVLYNKVAYIFTATHAAGDWDRTKVKRYVDTLERNVLNKDGTGNDPESNIK